MISEYEQTNQQSIYVLISSRDHCQDGIACQCSAVLRALLILNSYSMVCQQILSSMLLPCKAAF